MRLLIWSGSYPPSIGGVEVVVQGLARSLAARGMTVAVVTQASGTGTLVEHTPEGVVHRLPCHQVLSARDPGQVLDLTRQITALVRAFRPDVVHAHAVHPSEFFLLRALDRAPCPLVFTLHGWTTMTGGDQAIRERMLRAAAVITGCSRHVTAAIVDALPAVADRVETIYNGCVDGGVTGGARPVEPPRLLAAGRLVALKGFVDLIEAMPMVRASYPAAQLIITGDGPERATLEARCRQLGLDDCTQFTGELPRAGVLAQMNAATLVVVPSRTEGLGLVALEAALMERPVVARAVGGLTEAVVDGETGVLYDNSAALAAAITGLLDAPERATQMGRAGRARVRRDFDWDQQIDHYADAYARAVHRQRSS